MLKKASCVLLKIFKTIFSGSDSRFNLFVAFPKFYKLFLNQRLHLLWRRFLVSMLVGLVIMGFFGSQDPKQNSMLYLCWGLWWPLVIFSLFFVGRMWCGVCPFPSTGTFLQSLGLSFEIQVPKIIVKNSTEIAVGFFILIIWIEESTGMKDSPQETAWLLLSIWAGATFCALLFSKQSWCEYFCPLGTVMGIGSSISWLEFRPDHKVCRYCTTHNCIKGTEDLPGCPISLGAVKVTNNLNCLVCGHCLHLCPHNSPQLNVRPPLAELIIRKGKLITCTMMVPFLMGSQLARFLDQNIFNLMDKIQDVCMYNSVCQMGLYAIPLVLGFAIVHVTISYGDLFFGVYHDDLMGRFSPMIPIFLPLAFAGELVSRMNYTIRHLPEFFPTLGRQLSWEWLERVTITVPEWIYPTYGIFFIFLSEIAGLYLLQKFFFEEFEGIIPVWKYRAIQVAYFTLFGIYLCLMSTGWNIPSLNIMILFQQYPPLTAG